ncbi:MAG: metallophosphoesterase [Bacteroidota bacterium]|nr:metallophosphoesterase [Bacteroidota bacterium]
MAITKTGAQNIKICVASDLHFFDKSLLVKDGKAFRDYLNADRKMLLESEPILKALIDTILFENPDIFIVSGDLTKDGEKQSHIKVAGYLRKLKDAGIKVFVVPGNHDINNPHALKYNGDLTTSVPSVTPLEFDSIYSEFGYGNESEKDKNSLSYATNPIEDIEILAIDACKYDSNYVKKTNVTGGRLRSSTLDWLVNKSEEASRENKLLIGIMHHGMLEHFGGQKNLFKDYVIDDYANVSDKLAMAGLKIVFTGHFHAQDIVGRVTKNGYHLYDIETGSAVTFPCQYRVINLTKDKKFEVASKSIDRIEYNTGGKSLTEYSLDFTKTVMPGIILNTLTAEPNNMPWFLATYVEPALTETMIAHYAGDEKNPSENVISKMNYLKNISSTAVLGIAMDSIWHDPLPSDLNTNIDLSNMNNGILSKEEFEKIKIFPNPVKNGLTIVNSDAHLNGLLISLKDVEGKELINKICNDKLSNLDMSRYGNGMYILSIKGKNLDFRKKIVKN